MRALKNSISQQNLTLLSYCLSTKANGKNKLTKLSASLMEVSNNRDSRSQRCNKLLNYKWTSRKTRMFKFSCSAKKKEI